MRKNLLTFLFVGYAAFGYADSKVTYTADVIRSAEATQPTQVRLSTNVLVEAFKLSSEGAFEKALSEGSVKFVAKQGKTASTSSAKTYGKQGYWFTKDGIACANTNGNRRVACKYEEGYFHITHYADKVKTDDK